MHQFTPVGVLGSMWGECIQWGLFFLKKKNPQPKSAMEKLKYPKFVQLVMVAQPWMSRHADGKCIIWNFTKLPQCKKLHLPHSNVTLNLMAHLQALHHEQQPYSGLGWLHSHHLPLAPLCICMVVLHCGGQRLLYDCINIHGLGQNWARTQPRSSQNWQHQAKTKADKPRLRQEQDKWYRNCIQARLLLEGTHPP